MTPAEETIIRRWSAALAADIHLTLFRSGGPQDETLSAFCAAFGRVAPRIHFQPRDSGAERLPGIQIRPGLTYHAAPQGTELEPFLEAIQIVHQPNPSDRLATPTPTTATGLPAYLELFIAPQCPFCPTAVRQALPLLQSGNAFELAVVDSFLFPLYARDRAVKSVPTLLLEDDYRWTGSLPWQEVVQLIGNRDPAEMGPRSLRSLLEQGRADHLADMMINRRTVFPALYHLLLHPKWPVRLGAMVIVETLCERDPALARQVAEPLQKSFQTVDVAVQGDVLHTIGQTGDTDIISWLEEIDRTTSASEVKEAALEAVLAIRKRSGPN